MRAVSHSFSANEKKRTKTNKKHGEIEEAEYVLCTHIYLSLPKKKRRSNKDRKVNDGE